MTEKRPEAGHPRFASAHRLAASTTGLPADVIAKTSTTYIEASEKLTGKTL